MTPSLSATAAAGGPVLVCFSQLRWGFVFQRPQHLMTRAAKTYRVIFWEEPMFKPDVKPHLARFPQNERLEVITPMLPEGMSEEDATASLRSMLDELLSHEGAPAVCWHITPMMLAFSAHLHPSLTVYDKMDELLAFKNAPSALRDRERQLLDEAGVVFTGGMSIYEANKDAHVNIHPFPSSIDRAHFATARARHVEEPLDQSEIPAPRIGWFGVIDERMDLELLSKLAGLKPDWQFVMLGPVVKIDPSTLPRADNIHWLGSKDYSELPAYLAGWDAGFIPSAVNDSTRFISPTKTPEFLAAGVPVVATPIRDIVRPYGDDGLVAIAADADQMADALDRAMTAPKADWIAKVDHFLADKSWDQTWSEMKALMNKSSEDHLNQEEAA